MFRCHSMLSMALHTGMSPHFAFVKRLVWGGEQESADQVSNCGEQQTSIRPQYSWSKAYHREGVSPDDEAMRVRGWPV